ncbi:hypothetical protein BDY19DRAFT_932555 [Irpex rosettiformis]|uniref:Uncharacterized protein n=1 Tax=Irpex rosettiformis TaxID=378272 RepID=A0ACB8U9G3_9APHY|nr:hypothetical protein BDY19DRAFT_932555 [Irpex rosettiformis]
MTGCWIGPVPHRIFLDEFMFSASFSIPPNAQFPPKKETETAMYEPFFRAVKDSKICPRINFFITAYAHGPDRELQRPDGGANDYPFETASHRWIKHKQPFDWNKNGLIVEFKKGEGEDPFYSLEQAKTNNSIEKVNPASITTLGQLSGYAREAFLHQHRTHLFMLFIAGNTARFIRWDRAGAVVSAPSDYVEDSKPLAQFFWSYNKMSPAQRGWDMTVQKPSSAEVQQLQRAINDWITRHGGVEDLKRRFPGAELTLDEDYPVYKLVIEPEFGKRQVLVIQRPFMHSYDLVGSATRTYFAYSQTEKEVLFYKEGWRVEAEKGTSEATAYKHLSEHNVPHTPTVFCAGDVRVGGELIRTESNVWARKTEAEWYVTCSALQPRVLHRIVQRLYYPVQWLLSSREFVTVMRDCTIASEKSFEIGLLHRDISIGNVMANFEDDGKTFVEGILNDWDHFGYVSSNNQVRSIHRSGTWPFMSIEILRNPNVRHSIRDEMQSIFWVFLYGTFRFFDNNDAIIWDLFFDKKRKNVEGRVEYFGGGAKRDFFLQAGDFTEPNRTDGITTKALRDVVEAMALYWQYYYYMEGWWGMHGDWQPLHGNSARHDISATVRAAASIPLDGLLSERTASTDDNETGLLADDFKEMLSKPQTWITVFNRSLKDEPAEIWPSSDAVPDRYPQDKAKVMRMKERVEEIISINMGESYLSRSLPVASASADSEPPANALAGKEHARDDGDNDNPGDGDIDPSGSSSRFKKRRIARPVGSSDASGPSSSPVASSSGDLIHGRSIHRGAVGHPESRLEEVREGHVQRGRRSHKHRGLRRPVRK